MSTTTTSNLIMSLADGDVHQITTGTTKSPWRDENGNRSFTSGEESLLRMYEQKVHSIKSLIKKERDKLAVYVKTRIFLSDQLGKQTEIYDKDRQADENLLTEISTKVDKMEAEALPTLQPNADELSQKKDKKRKVRGLLSFLFVAFAAEGVSYLATFNLQQENLSTDAIWWRLAYIGVIYLYTIILYVKYIKTHIKIIKLLLTGCILLGFICLLHAIAVTFLNLDVTTTTSALYDLNQISSFETEASTSFLYNLISRPGLVEFLIATMLVFLGEIVALDERKTDETDTTNENATISHDEPNCIDFEDITQQCSSNHILILKNKQTMLLERINKRTVKFNDYVNNIKSKLELNEEEEREIQTNLDSYQQDMEMLHDKIVSDLVNYRKLLLYKLSFKLDVNESDIQYELATKADIKAFYEL